MRNFYLASFSYGHCYFYVHSTKELIKRRLIQNFNIPAGATPRVFELLKIGSFKFPPPFPPPSPPGQNFVQMFHSSTNFYSRIFECSTNVVIKSFWCCCWVFRLQSSLWKASWENFLSSHSFSKAGSLPWNSTTSKSWNTPGFHLTLSV